MAIRKTLRDLSLRHSYDSDSDDILNEFYIPALSVSSRYRRLAGFFSSSTLAAAARGIAAFVRNGGRMELVCGARLSKQDVEAMESATKDPADVIASVGIRELSDIEDEFVRDHVAALGWMIANGTLTIKIALVTGADGTLLDTEEADREAIFHQKVGILDDGVNSISFSGSDNETAAGWVAHVEEFKVFCGWNTEHTPFLEADVEKFNKFWEGRAIRTRVVELPQALADHLVRIAPARFEDLDLSKWSRVAKPIRKQLWAHQLAAVSRWFEADCRGILEMATGTGKTLTALQCLREVFEHQKKVLAVMAFPYSHLLRQWLDDYSDAGISARYVIVDSSNPGWRNELSDALIDLRMGVRQQLVVFTTHDSASSPAFLQLLTSFADDRTVRMLVVDEVHGIGSSEQRNALLPSYNMRLGLSATPARWFDEEGTQLIRDYFGGTVFEFTLRDAINTINPSTGESFLAPYVYRPVFVRLSEPESEQYIELTEKISRVSRFAEKDSDAERMWENLLFKRQRILNNAQAKLPALETILRDLGRVQHCLVYCAPEQLESVQALMNRMGVDQHKFTMEEGVTPSDLYGGLTERQFLLQEFSSGTYQALVAMRCLDEGVNVPPARIGILLASSGNPREFIQRRGRLLRRSPGKTQAEIYDLICTPPVELIARNERLLNVERKILEKETRRFLEFARDATNYVECLDLLHAYEHKLGL